MTYTSKHLRAVQARLMEYEMTLLSGYNCLEYPCKLCGSILQEVCNCCILYYCFTRKRLALRKLSVFCVKLTEEELSLVRARYEEILETIRRRLK